MTKKALLLVVLLLSLLPLQLFHLYNNNNRDRDNVAGIQSSFPIINSVYIGEFRFTLFGYTSPGATVSLNGQGINDQTISDKTGYFEFTNRFSPFSPREACLSSRDQFGRISAPICLPAFPTQANVSIGPVIIPPTLSFDKNDYFTGDEVILTGQTIPSAEVDLSVFTQVQPASSSFLTRLISSISHFQLIRSVDAFSIPHLSAKSDPLGNFSISLPSSSAQNYRLFTQVNYHNLPSANSLTLTLKIIPVWMVFLRFFGLILSIFRDRMLEVTIILEILGLTAYYLRLFTPYRLKRSIVIYRPNLPIIEHKNLPILKEKYSLVKS